MRRLTCLLFHYFTAISIVAGSQPWLLRRGRTDAFPQRRRLDEPLVRIPEFVGDWVSIPDYKLDVGEAQGALLGTELTIVGGFLPGFSNGAKETYSLDLAVPNADWVQLADCPVDPFVTHAAHAVKGHKLYLCGGYLGGNPGPEMQDCYEFDRNGGADGVWNSLPFLPEGRGGGAMVYIAEMNSLLFSLGAERPDGLDTTIDRRSTWMLDLDRLDVGWESKADGPYLGNHLSAIAANDCDGNVHYFFFGGQVEENEQSGNIDLVFGYIPSDDSWVQRASMPEGRGHASSSTVAYGCGFMVVAGSVNGNPDARSKTKSIIYYDIPTDTWTEIGDYEQKTNTPVCAEHSDELFCTSGYRVDGWKRQLAFPSVLQSPTAAPISTPTTSMPTNQPTSLPTTEPTTQPTTQPTKQPTFTPTEQPTTTPTDQPTPEPTNQPTPEPTDQSTPEPPNQPTREPTDQSTTQPANQPTPEPTNQPTPDPTNQPTTDPTNQPTPEPTNQPTPEPPTRSDDRRWWLLVLWLFRRNN